jgi:hypothetical protein
VSATSCWAIVSLFGHTQLAGRVSEVQRFGETLALVEVPLEDGSFRREYVGGKAIFRVSECTEEVARAAALPPRWYLLKAANPTEGDAPVMPCEGDDIPFDDSGDRASDNGPSPALYERDSEDDHR